MQIHPSTVAVLNAARSVLSEIVREAEDAARDADDNYAARNFGRLVECADNAERGVFDVLNTARSFCDIPLTDEQVHNRKGES